MTANIAADNLPYLVDLIRQHENLFSSLAIVEDEAHADRLLRELGLIEAGILRYPATSAEAKLTQANWIIAQVQDCLSPSLQALASRLAAPLPAHS